MKREKIEEALFILKTLGLPRGQQNERSALSLLALLYLGPDKLWRNARNPLMGITPLMDWMMLNYGKKYMPNTRETVRRQTIHQFVEAGVAVYNPGAPNRPVNSPKTVYQISNAALQTIKTYGTPDWDSNVACFLANQTKLVDQYAHHREIKKVRIKVDDKDVVLSPGKHSSLIKNIIEDFGGYFVPNGRLVYAGDTGNKHGYTDVRLMRRLGIEIDKHGKMPDVIIYCSRRKWLLLIEAVTSHGPVDSKRHQELKDVFSKVRVGLVYVTAFSTRSIMCRYLSSISWETEVWLAESPTHLIHFNGSRFLGPYEG